MVRNCTYYIKIVILKGLVLLWVEDLEEGHATFMPQRATAGAGAAEPEGATAQGGDGAPGGPQIWAVADLKRMERRRYLLVHCALELFVSTSAIFFHMPTKRAPKPPYRTNYLLGERDGATARC